MFPLNGLLVFVAVRIAASAFWLPLLDAQQVDHHHDTNSSHDTRSKYGRNARRQSSRFVDSMPLNMVFYGFSIGLGGGEIPKSLNFSISWLSVWRAKVMFSYRFSISLGGLGPSADGRPGAVLSKIAEGTWR